MEHLTICLWPYRIIFDSVIHVHVHELTISKSQTRRACAFVKRSIDKSFDHGTIFSKWPSEDHSPSLTISPVSFFLFLFLFIPMNSLVHYIQTKTLLAYSCHLIGFNVQSADDNHQCIWNTSSETFSRGLDNRVQGCYTAPGLWSNIHWRTCSPGPWCMVRQVYKRLVRCRHNFRDKP